MGYPTGFLDIKRREPPQAAIAERVQNFKEYVGTLTASESQDQAGRCMDCGIPFCMHQCPLHNPMPDLNAAACRGDWARAYALLAGTDNFPEITGRICPALCEEGCTLGLHAPSVAIRSLEKFLAETAFARGWVKAVINPHRSFKKAAVVGSGPAALACAQELARRGHGVTVYEKMDKPGGLLRYGIPDFKLPKDVLDRRLAQLELEGVEFKTGVFVGDPAGLERGIHQQAQTSVRAAELLARYDAVILAPGSETPRDLPVPGRTLPGIYFALDFLIAQNRENNGDGINPIDVAGKQVVIIGGGETASDCIGVSLRKGAAHVTQIDYHDELPLSVPPTRYWPEWRPIKRTSTSQAEGGTRLFSAATTAFVGEQAVSAVALERVVWAPGHQYHPVPDSAFTVPADVVLIAMGYAGPSRNLLAEFDLNPDTRGRVPAATAGADAYRTARPKIFAAGDGRRGQSLVVHALAEGRACALSVDNYLRSGN